MKPSPQKKSTTAKTIRDVLLLCITVGLIYWFLAPDEDRPFNPISMDDLQGVWTTTHPQYRDRFLQFSDTTVTFGWGQAGAGAYSIDEIDSEPADNRTLVRIRYVDLAATDYQLSFYYMDQYGGMIKMKNKKEVYWYRTNTEPTYNPDFK